MVKTRVLGLEYSERAADQLDEIDAFTRPRNERYADKLKSRIRKTCERLTRFPYLGRFVYPRGMRAISIAGEPYVIIYNVIGTPPTTIRIAGMFHTSLGERKL